MDVDDKPMENIAQDFRAEEMSKGAPPAYVPEPDTRPLLVAEQHPRPHGPSPFGTIHAHPAAVVTNQPIATAVYRAETPAWIGPDLLIYFSVFTMLCCGFLPGLMALILSWEARSKKELGQTGEAKAYTMAAILCNVIGVVLGVGAIIAVSVYYGILYTDWANTHQ